MADDKNGWMTDGGFMKLSWTTIGYDLYNHLFFEEFLVTGNLYWRQEHIAR
jgi:hypothetical protein